MKKGILFAGLAMMVMMAGCDEKARLAKDLQGEWTSNPERLTDVGEAASASMVRMMEFTRGTGDTEGIVTMTAMISVENTMRSADSTAIVSPLQITASGTATISGVYQAVDDDEVIISLDGTTMSVDVDPEGVVLNYNVITEDSSPSVDKLKPGVVVLATQQITHAAKNAFSNLTKIDDIKLKGNMMTCEINKRDFIFSKVGGVGVLPGKK